VKKAKKDLTPENMRSAQKALDKAAKGNAIHKNRASRLKSHLAKRMSKASAK